MYLCIHIYIIDYYWGMVIPPFHSGIPMAFLRDSQPWWDFRNSKVAYDPGRP